MKNYEEIKADILSCKNYINFKRKELFSKYNDKSKLENKLRDLIKKDFKFLDKNYPSICRSIYRGTFDEQLEKTTLKLLKHRLEYDNNKISKKNFEDISKKTGGEMWNNLYKNHSKNHYDN